MGINVWWNPLSWHVVIRCHLIEIPEFGEHVISDRLVLESNLFALVSMLVDSIFDFKVAHDLRKFRLQKVQEGRH